MNSIRLKNMRCLKDTKTIDLKPINILVGNNSSGKSTFLRMFPLLKQSFLRRINGPILWVGDDGDDVDFGSFKETLNKDAKSKFIEVEFNISYNINNILDRMKRYTLLTFDSNKYNILKSAKLKICISNKNNDDFISKFSVTCDKDSIMIDNTMNKIFFNKKNLDEFCEINRIKLLEDHNVKDKSFFEMINEKMNFKDIEQSLKLQIYSDEIKNSTNFDFLEEELFNRIAAEVFINNDINIDSFISEFEMDLKKRNPEIQEVLFKNTKIKISDKALKNDVLDKLKIIFISEIAKYCINYINKYFLNVNYIKPVRAHAERYYRLRNLSVDQIDSDGKNLPIFIKSLPDKKLNQYNTWLYNNFGFTVKPIEGYGHVSINIEIGERSINLSDTGYGYSQLLPIITQLWVATENKNLMTGNFPIVFAIEQLELHLHPELQAKLIDVIVRIANLKRNNIQFILETHSEVVINRIGNLIYKNKINKNDVNVILFNKKMIDNNTEISISKFDDDGFLENWPIGFFSVGDIE